MIERMELKQLKPVPQSKDEDKVLDLVASKIRPLPTDLVPSQEFMQRTRLKLLKLRPQTEPSERRAA